MPLDPDEPKKVAESVALLGLKYVVLTSVTRDDIPDGGASWFADTMREIRSANPFTLIEVLTPDFWGGRFDGLDPDTLQTDRIQTVVNASPVCYNHNIETVPRLYRAARGRAEYRRSLDLLERVKRTAPTMVTKAGLMLGIGETIDELFEVLADLRAIRCDVLTLGQYLAPTLKQSIPVARYVPPEEFDDLAAKARLLGFKQVAAGPFVRSSYHADEMVPGN